MSDVMEPALAPEPAAEPSPPPAAPRRGMPLLASAQSLAATIVIAVFVITFIVQAFQIPSESMEKTLLIGDYLLVDKVHYGHGGRWDEILPYSQIRRGDIIVFRYPVHPQQHFVKRVIGIPGDHVRMQGRQVLINGVPLTESYVVHTKPDYDHFRDDFPLMDIPNASTDPRWWMEMGKFVENGELIVPKDRYFVLGDNRDESLDSRYWGFVPRGNIIGRPLLIYWSVRPSRTPADASASRSGRLSAFLYSVSHALQNTRWDRTFRIVR